MPRPKTTHTDTKSVQRQVSCFVWHRHPPTWWRVVVSLRLLNKGGAPPPPCYLHLALPVFFYCPRVYFRILSPLPMSFWLVPRYLARCFASFSLSYFMAQTFPTFVLFCFSSQPSCALLFSPAKHQRCLSISHPPGLYKSDGTRIPNYVWIYIYKYLKVSSLFTREGFEFSNSSSFHSHHHHHTAPLFFYFFIRFFGGSYSAETQIEKRRDYFRSIRSLLKQINLAKKGQSEIKNTQQKKSTLVWIDK